MSYNIYGTYRRFGFSRTEVEKWNGNVVRPRLISIWICLVERSSSKYVFLVFQAKAGCIVWCSCRPAAADSLTSVTSPVRVSKRRMRNLFRRSIHLSLCRSVSGMSRWVVALWFVGRLWAVPGARPRWDCGRSSCNRHRNLGFVTTINRGRPHLVQCFLG